MNIERNQRPMETLPGSVGTGASLALRMSQTIFSAASLLFMSLAVPFYGYTSFGFLVTIMALVIPWSFILALVDGYYILVKCPGCRPGKRIVLFIIMGDWVLSTLTLAGACSTATVVDLLVTANAPYFTPKVCNRYQISFLMAFLSWSLSLASSLVNLWLLPYM